MTAFLEPGKRQVLTVLVLSPFSSSCQGQRPRPGKSRGLALGREALGRSRGGSQEAGRQRPPGQTEGLPQSAPGDKAWTSGETCVGSRIKKYFLLKY